MFALPTFDAHDRLVTAAYSAAITLTLTAIVDPVALENAPLRHRATAPERRPAPSSAASTSHKPSPLEGVTYRMGLRRRRG
ncbi:MAG: hypothetical protein IPK19_24605 [Chloroflexi bacterium]|nr:hypothetical protein [Chloroflexota bacterium]